MPLFAPWNQHALEAQLTFAAKGKNPELCYCGNWIIFHFKTEQFNAMYYETAHSGQDETCRMPDSLALTLWMNRELPINVVFGF